MNRVDQLEAHARVLWGLYDSTVRTGGTPEQREWAYARWARANEQAAAVRRTARLAEIEKAKAA